MDPIVLWNGEESFWTRPDTVRDWPLVQQALEHCTGEDCLFIDLESNVLRTVLELFRNGPEYPVPPHLERGVQDALDKTECEKGLDFTPYRLNVGGKIFHASRRTLERSNYFHSLFQRWQSSLDLGFFDRDASLFANVLCQLRQPWLEIATAEESAFWGLPQVVPSAKLSDKYACRIVPKTAALMRLKAALVLTSHTVELKVTEVSCELQFLQFPLMTSIVAWTLDFALYDFNRSISAEFDAGELLKILRRCQSPTILIGKNLKVCNASGFRYKVTLRRIDDPLLCMRFEEAPQWFATVDGAEFSKFAFGGMLYFRNWRGRLRLGVEASGKFQPEANPKLVLASNTEEEITLQFPPICHGHLPSGPMRIGLYKQQVLVLQQEEFSSYVAPCG